MEQTPLFSIVIPVYNRAHLIERTLLSVFNQTFKNYEVIIVDDGSSDNLKQVVEQFISKYNLLNWNYYYKINQERGAARNYGVDRSKAEYVTFLDSDDLLYPNHLQLASQFLHQSKNTNVFHSAYEYINLDTNSIRKVNYKIRPINKSLLKGNIMSCFGVFAKRTILLKIRFDEERELSGSEDWLLWLKLIAEFEIKFQPVITGSMVEHDGRSVLNFTSEQLYKRAELMRQKLNNSKSFSSKFGKEVINKIYAHMLSYGALHLVLAKKRKTALQMLFTAIKNNPIELFSRRMLAIIKRIV